MTVAHELPARPDAAAESFRLTWDEYLRLEDPPGFRYEFDQGVLLVSPTGKNKHGVVISILVTDLRNHQRRSGGCVVFVEQSFFMPRGERDLRPDVAVITDGRIDHLDPDDYVDGAPNIVVEVLSPRTEARDRRFKAARYFEQGAEELWLFDPATDGSEFYARTADGWEPRALDGTIYATPLLPGFVLDVAALWEEVGQTFGCK